MSVRSRATPPGTGYGLALNDREQVSHWRAVCIPRRARPWLALAFYVLCGLLSAGSYAIRDPTRVCACIGNADPALFMWSLAWWPHALAAGNNPLVQHVLWSPVGSNLARSTTVPTAALLLAPVTVLFGPLVAYNVMAIASPVLAAFTAYLLCRRLLKAELPALAGGLLFGFGAYEFAQLVGHPNLALVFLIPVVAHLAIRRAAGELSGRRYVLYVTVVLVAQMGLSTELLASTVALGFLLLLVARILAPAGEQAQLNRVIVENVAACLLAGLICSPFLYYALVKGGAPQESPIVSDQYGLDLLNPLFPTRSTWLGSHVFERTPFMGPPAVRAGG